MKKSFVILALSVFAFSATTFATVTESSKITSVAGGKEKKKKKEDKSCCTKGEQKTENTTETGKKGCCSGNSGTGCNKTNSTEQKK